MIIKNKTTNFPFNDLALTFIISIPAAIPLYFLMFYSSYEKLWEVLSFYFFFFIELVVFIIFITIIIKYLIHKNRLNEITYFNLNKNNIQVTYHKNEITIDKADIDSIDIKITLLQAITTYNKGMPLICRRPDIVEYIDLSIKTKNNKVFKIRKDFFILYNSVGSFLKELKDILENYKGLYNINFSRVSAGLLMKEEQAIIVDLQIDELIKKSSKDMEIGKIIGIIFIVGFFIIPIILEIFFNLITPLIIQFIIK